jgi:hypothetical protein
MHILLKIQDNKKKIPNLYLSSSKEEKEFYMDIKKNLSYSIITKKGIWKKMFFKEYKNNYKLTFEQKEVLIVIILGDGYLDRVKLSFNTKLHIEQSYPDKEDYLLSLFHIFKPLIVNDPKIIIRKADKRTGKVYKSIAVRTSAFSCLNEYYNLFYQNKIKVIPNNINELISARSLAYWIMDDGGKSYNQTILHTRAFMKKDVEKLQNTLKLNFKLDSYILEKLKINELFIFL